MACFVDCTKQTSGLPIGIDATCSGLQHLASMTLDRTAAAQVNVVRGTEDRPADGYRTVAAAACKYIKDPEVHDYIDRKTTKRTVMTSPYGVSRNSARDYIRSALIEKGFDLSIKGRLPEIVTAIYEKAVPEVFEGPVKVMELAPAHGPRSLRDTRGHHLDNSLRLRRHTRPSQVQELDHQDQAHGPSHEGAAVGDGWGDPDVKHHVGAIAPNLVHSLDASLIHLTFVHWDQPFTVIHDCVLGRSCDMTQMSHEIRHHHAEMYKALPLVDWANQVGAVIPDGMIIGDLDMDEVLDSPYFFC